MSRHTALFAEKYQPVGDRVSILPASGRYRRRAAHLNFFRGFEYDPTADCDAIIGVEEQGGKRMCREI